LDEQVAQTLELQQRFEKEPQGFKDQELLQRTVPEWTAEQVDISPEWVRSLQREPAVWVRMRSMFQSERPPLPALQGLAAMREIPNAFRYEGSEDLFARPEFHRGEFEIQDLSSQIVGHLCAPNPGETWWDACAGEGGKTLHLSDLMQNKGLIWASDRAEWRLQKLKRRAARARMFNYRLAQWDGGRKLPTKTKFDGVLIDAPCSGVGTWQRNPHARWTTSLCDVLELQEVQQRLLVNASEAVKPGGKLIYAVCTLTRSETVEVARNFEKAVKGFERMLLRNLLNGSETPEIWIWPQEFGSNGMFIAAWQRK
jgi:16S rRNA (cytosine967-C5)-methyltransferase